MAQLQNNIKVNTETIPIDSNGLFSRLVALGQRESSIESCFRYELAAEPMSLFKNGMMWKSNKSELKKSITSDVISLDKVPTKNFVIDGRGNTSSSQMAEKFNIQRNYCTILSVPEI